MLEDLDATGPAIYSSALRQSLVLGGRIMLASLLKRMKSARRQNSATLRRILTRNQRTEFGELHSFDQILRSQDIEATYRQELPLGNYSTFEPFLLRMADGEQNVLCIDTPLGFSYTSGTTGPAKLLPVVRANQSLSLQFMAFISHAVAMRHFSPQTPWNRGIGLLSTAVSGNSTQGGYPIGTASALGTRRMGAMLEQIWCSPVPVFSLQDENTAWYLHALYGLQNRKTQYIAATFSGLVLQWLQLMQKRWDELLRDIEQGTLTPHLDLPDGLRPTLEKSLRPRPQRAQELRAAVKAGFDGCIPRVWPEMKYVQTVTTGAFEVYLPMLKRWLGGLPVYSGYYGASELPLGLSLWPDRVGHYALPIGAGYYEFIPYSATNSDSPPTLGPADLQVGERYEIVITNFAGLYRYRMGDIVSISGFYGEAPLMQFQHRRETIVDLLGEKTTETHTENAVSGFVKNWLGQVEYLKDYTVAPNWNVSPPRYTFYLEVNVADPSIYGPVLDSLAADLDRQLCAANVLYQHKRRLGVIAPLVLKLVAPGAFQRLREYLIERSSSDNRNQVKIPRCIKDPDRLGWLENQVMFRS